MGVDISNSFVPLEDFDSSVTATPDDPRHVGFVDVEGQGNRDVEYDAKVE